MPKFIPSVSLYMFSLVYCNVMKCNVNVEFKVTLHEQVRYRGTLQY